MLYSTVYFLAFVPTLWLGLYLLVHRANDRRVWPVIPALLGAAAAQLCALMALTAGAKSMATFWRHGIVLVEPVFLLSYVTIGLVLTSKDRSSSTRKVAIFSSYAISLTLAAAGLRAVGQGGTAAIYEGPWGSIDQHIGVIYLVSGVIVIVLILSCMLMRRGRNSSSHDTLSPARIAAMSGLGFVGVVPLFPLLPSDLAGLCVKLSLLSAMVAIGYGVLRFRPLLSQFSWNEQPLRLLGNALVLTLYIAGSSVLMWWLIRIRISDSPLLIALALSSLGIGVLEAIRLRILGNYLRKLLPQGDWGYYQMSRTIQRALVEQDLSRMMQIVLNRLCKRWDVPKGFIALRDDGDRFKIRAAHGTDSIRIGDSIDLPVATESSFPEGTGQAFTEEMALLIPIEVRSSQYGVLALGSRAIGDFDDVEIQLFAALAHQLSVAVENLQLKRQISDQLTNLAAESDEVLHRQTLLRESLHSTLTGLEAARRQRLKQVRVRCLGRFEVHVDQRRIEDKKWGGNTSGHRHAKALFAYLVANRDRLVRRDELIDVIWGGSADLSILENRLNRTISSLRRALEPTIRAGAESSYIMTGTEGYRLNPAIQWWIDAEEFSRLLQEAEVLEHSGNKNDALAKYEEAEELYQGDYMIDCAFLDRSHGITIEREALRQKYLDLLVCIARLHQRNGVPEMGIQYLQQAALEDEFNEEVYRALVRSYCAAGRCAEAVLVCETHSSVLAQAGLPCNGDCLPPEVQSRR